MAAKRKISYDAAIGDFMQKHFSNCKLNRSGRDLISDILQEIHSSLIKNFETEYQSTKEITDTKCVENKCVIKCVERAVKKSLPTGIRTHAMAEASRQLMLFQQGLLEYDHVASIKALKESPEYSGKSGKSSGEGDRKKARPAHRTFATAASKIVSVMYSKMKLESEAKHFLGFHLHTLAKHIATKAAENAAGKQELECVDIQKSLSEFFSSEVLNIAYGEGNRNLFQHVHGINVFKPRKPSKQPLVDESMIKKKHSKDLQGTPVVKAESSTIFRDGIRKLLSQTINIHPPPKIDEGGKRISDVLFNIADYISDKVAERSRNEHLTEIDFTDVKEVINEIFPKVLLDHAVYYGFGNVKDFLQGIFRYKKRPPPLPKMQSAPRETKSKMKSPKRRSRSKAPASKRKNKLKSRPIKRSRKNEKVELTKTKEKVKPKELNFSKGILYFVQQSFSNSSVSVGREGTERINSCLLDVCKALIGECASQHTVLTPEAIRATADKFFPRQIARHALALADRFLCDNEDSLAAATSLQRGEMRMETSVPESQPEIKQEPTEEPKSELSTETVAEPPPDA